MPSAGGARTSLPPFLIASGLLHLLVALLLPVGGVVRLIGSPDRRHPARPGGEVPGGPSSEDGQMQQMQEEIASFLPLGALRLQVLEIEIESEAKASESPRPPARRESVEVEEPAPVPVEAAAPTGLPATGRPAGEGLESADASRAAAGSGAGNGSDAGLGAGSEGDGEGGGGEGGQIVPPVIIAMSWPEEPPGARKQARVPVVLAVHVTETGAVDAVRVENESGCPACERVAVASAWRLRFLPGTRGGEPIAMWMSFPFTFGRR